jgi:hypothetical protein
MGRNYLWFRQGDANNAVLAAAGYNFRRLIRWLRLLLRHPHHSHCSASTRSRLKSEFFTDDYLRVTARILRPIGTIEGMISMNV